MYMETQHARAPAVHTRITTTLLIPRVSYIPLLHTLEREGGGEYSEARLSWLGTVVWKFMSKSIVALGTEDFEC